MKRRQDITFYLTGLSAMFLTPILCRALGTNGCRNFLSRYLQARPARAASPDRLFRHIDRIAKLVPWASCLHQSIAGWCLLRHYGVDTRLILGVRFIKGKFDAHAWIEHQGQAVYQEGQEIESYTPFNYITKTS